MTNITATLPAPVPPLVRTPIDAANTRTRFRHADYRREMEAPIERRCVGMVWIGLILQHRVPVIQRGNGFTLPFLKPSLPTP
jgi:hypothetical protein